MAEKTETKVTQKGEITDEIRRLFGLLKQGEKDAKETAREISAIESSLAAEKQRLLAIATVYNVRRQQLLFEELKRQELTWCSCCLKLMPEKATILIFVRGRGEFTRNYDKYIGNFENFSYLERVCSSCKTNILHIQKQVGKYLHSSTEWPFLSVFTVEKRDDGFYLSTGEGIVDGQCDLIERITNKNIDSFCEQLGLPPRMSEKDGKLIVKQSSGTRKADNNMPN